MVYLILAILSSACVSILMRLSEARAKNSMVLFLSNYTVCAFVSTLFIRNSSLFPAGGGIGYAMGLGVIGGVFFLGSLFLLRLNIRKNGVVLSSIFMKLGVLVPIIMAMVFFRELPNLPQVMGLFIAIAAILVINLEPDSHAAGKHILLLLILLLAGGFTDSLLNIYDKTGAAQWKDHFLFYIFLSAGMLCLVAAIIKRQGVTPADFCFGAAIGIPNYFSSRFLMLALSSVPAIVAYPVYNVATIVVISLAGVLLFREKLSRRKLVSISLIALALVLLNL